MKENIQSIVQSDEPFLESKGNLDLRYDRAIANGSDSDCGEKK
jgi:hypothetical protein